MKFLMKWIKSFSNWLFSDLFSHSRRQKFEKKYLSVVPSHLLCHYIFWSPPETFNTMERVMNSWIRGIVNAWSVMMKRLYWRQMTTSVYLENEVWTFFLKVNTSMSNIVEILHCIVYVFWIFIEYTRLLPMCFLFEPEVSLHSQLYLTERVF